jgi:hypothetical protein
MRRHISWKRHMAKRKELRWSHRMHPPVMPMVMFGFMAREEFVKVLAEYERRILYGDPLSPPPQGILGAVPSNRCDP